MYFIEKNLNRLNNLGSTFFLDPKELRELKGKLGKEKYSIYYPYPDSEKCIVYKEEIPEVLLYEIHIKIEVRHQDILGSMYSLNIASELFGDILLIDGHYYIYILGIVRNYFESNFLMVRNASVSLEEIPLNTLEDYHRDYETIELIVSSNRIDTVISSICHVGRSSISLMMQKKDILLNYDYLKDTSYKLKEGDVFSIRRIGKYKYGGILKNTKSNHLVIQIFQYK